MSTSNKVKLIIYIILIILSLTLIGVLVMSMERCSICNSPFHHYTFHLKQYNFNDYEQNDVNKYATNQTTTRLVTTDRAGTDYLNSIAFVGDSRTMALPVLTDVSENMVFGEDGLNHEIALYKEVVRLDNGNLVTIADAIKITAPKIMIVNFGINGAAWLPKDKFIEGYSALIDQLTEAAPYSIIVIESIMPVSANYELHENGVSNEQIDILNDALYDLAKERGLYYLGTNEVLKDENNNLYDDFHNGDGLHYSKLAYTKIIDYILTHAINKK